MPTEYHPEEVSASDLLKKGMDTALQMGIKYWQEARVPLPFIIHPKPDDRMQFMVMSYPLDELLQETEKYLAEIGGAPYYALVTDTHQTPEGVSPTRLLAVIGAEAGQSEGYMIAQPFERKGWFRREFRLLGPVLYLGPVRSLLPPAKE